MKKIVSTVLIVLVSVFCYLPAFAIGNSVTRSTAVDEVFLPQFQNLSYLSAGLSINSSGKAACTGDVSIYNDSYTSVLTVALQKNTSSGWTTIQSWSDTAEGVDGVVVSGHYYVVSGSYRVCSTAQIYNSSSTLLETASIYSEVQTY